MTAQSDGELSVSGASDTPQEPVDVDRPQVRIRLESAWVSVIARVAEGVPLQTAALAEGLSPTIATEAAHSFERRHKQTPYNRKLGERLSRARARARAAAIVAGDRTINRRELEERGEYIDPPSEVSEREENARERARIHAVMQSMIVDDDDE